MAVKRRPSSDPESLLAKVAEDGSVGQFRKGHVVFSQGGPADAVFYLQSGNVKVTVASQEGKPVAVAILEAPAFFGEGCLAGQTRRMGTVTVMTDAVIGRLNKAAVLRMIRDDPAFSEMFIVHLAGLAARLKTSLLDQLLNSGETRLVQLLLRMTDGRSNGEARATIANVSQDMLADMIGTTRPRASFFMNKFRKLGLVDYKAGTNGRIEVHRALLKAALHQQLRLKT